MRGGRSRRISRRSGRSGCSSRCRSRPVSHRDRQNCGPAARREARPNEASPLRVW
jgi:hypothetical protein